MSKITVDEPLVTKLNALDDPIEICDQAGKSLGHFLPAGIYRDLLYDLAKALVSDEELEERRRESGEVSTAEVIAKIEQLFKTHSKAS